MSNKIKIAFTKFTEKHAELFKFIKFSIAGMLSSIVEVIIYYLLAYLVFANLDSTSVNIWILNYENIGIMWSFIISTTIGYAIAFIMNRKITFAADANPVFSIVVYAAMVIFTIFATTWIGMETIELTSTQGETIAKIGELLSKPLAMLLATAWTYPINRFIIHRKKKTA